MREGSGHFFEPGLAHGENHDDKTSIPEATSRPPIGCRTLGPLRKEADRRDYDSEYDYDLDYVR